MTKPQEERAVALLSLMAMDDGPKWRDLIGTQPCFLDFWLQWRDHAHELLFEIEREEKRKQGGH